MINWGAGIGWWDIGFFVLAGLIGVLFCVMASVEMGWWGALPP